ncbi:Utp21-domain-containing protein [Neolentinus lepideus HHB14362 ss-1]|uniref:Utp21-domain-containing protein n=1 Tax=Neolentinus lepideus HHB14362 ss-1 TaxID=1314782 RepID=A0A165TAG6_9AGAM|nr:Utp21-domain-containing protein [Neolentinus lepideus HHB14362 ss-1]
MTAVPDGERIAAPPRKRRRSKLSESLDGAKKTEQPRLFAPFRALGLVTNHVPFVLQTRSFKGATEGPRTHILTCLGNSWALWEGGKMGLLFVGPDAPYAISSMVMDGDAVWVVSGPYIIKYLRGKEVGRVENPLGIHLSSCAIIGSQILALTQDGKRLFVWNKEDGDVKYTLEFEPGFTATTLLHPATYINKILVGSVEGGLQLWNIRTQACIHKFSSSSLLSSPSSSAFSGSSCAITALTQSPAIDVVGIGFATGEISVYDVRADECLMRMFMEGGSIRALGFRSDGHAILASASSTGHIALWDLNAGGQLLHILRGAHDGPIAAIEWIPGQPVMISSGEDNSVRYWLFDSPTAPPRLLKYRSGHHTPPHLIRYYGDDGKQLLSASRDRSLRCTSIVRDSRSFEMSQGSLAKKASSLSIPLMSLKFPPVTALAYSPTRSKDWDDVVTAHTDESCARSWSVLNKRLGKHILDFADSGKGKVPIGSVKAVCVTACGNFGIAGSSTGAIHSWNMQSGMKRKSFDLGPCPPQVTNRFRSSSKKEGRCVTGLATDALNRVLIASTLDGTVNFFDFHSAKLDHSIVLPSSAVSITLQQDSGLLAVVCDDLIVRVIDIETQRIVRELGGFRGRVLDIAFSPDSRWLIASSLDSVIRTFDLPTGRLIDAFRTASVATSITFSPTGDFLATSHVDSVGVYLWANRAQYAEVSFQSLSDEDVVDVVLPSMHGTEEEEGIGSLAALSAPRDLPKDVFVTAPQLEGDLVTLTLLPRSRWQTLLNLEVIQQRNKPKEPPKQPEKAPFFLPTLPGLEPRFAVEQKAKEDSVKQKTKRLQKASAESESTFQKKLEAESLEGDFETFFNYAKSLSPAALDVELRSLVALDDMRLFLKAMVQRLRSRKDFEAVETMLAVFLRMHGDVLIANAEVRDDLNTLLQTQRRESERVMELIASSLGTLAFIRDTL